MKRRRAGTIATWLVVGALAAVTACSGDGSPDAGANTTAGSDVGGSDASVTSSATSSPSTSVTVGSTTRPASTSSAAGASTTSEPAVPSTGPSSTLPPTTPAPVTTAVPTTTVATVDQIRAVVQSFTGGTPGTADPAAGTFAIGWVNQEGGAPSFSDATLGLAAAVEYVNRELSGVGGRLIELRTCAIQREADGARCAQQFRDDPAVSVVVSGAVTVGNAGLLDGLRDAKPVVLANPLTTADYLASDAVAYTPGSPGIISGLARFAAERLPGGPPAKVAVLYPYGLAGEAAFQLLAKPVFDRFGVTAVAVPVLENAAPSEYAPLLTTAGVGDAAAFLPILSARGCVGLDQALIDLGSAAPVLATDTCVGTAMTAHLAATGRSGVVPEGWYVGGSGYRFGLEGSAEQQAFLTIAVQYLTVNRLAPIDLTGYAATSFGTALAVVRIANALGAAAGDPAAMRDATRAFTGPMWAVVGPQSCGFDPFYPSLCGTQMGVQRYVAGAWTSVADGYNGASIELADLQGG